MNDPRQRGRPRTFDRNALLDAALEQFWLRGFDGASISELTAASGCTAPTLYAQFGSKEGLFEAAVGRYVELAFGARTEMLAGGPADRKALEEMLVATIEASTAADHPPGCLILTGGLVGAGTAPAGAIASVRAFILAGFQRFLARAQETGHLGPCDVDALARFYMSVAQGIAAQAVDGATREQLTPLVEMALKAWPASQNR